MPFKKHLSFNPKKPPYASSVDFVSTPTRFPAPSLLILFTLIRFASIRVLAHHWHSFSGTAFEPTH
jgi:hypothetical protein